MRPSLAVDPARAAAAALLPAEDRPPLSWRSDGSDGSDSDAWEPRDAHAVAAETFYVWKKGHSFTPADSRHRPNPRDRPNGQPRQTRATNAPQQGRRGPERTHKHTRKPPPSGPRATENAHIATGRSTEPHIPHGQKHRATAHGPTDRHTSTHEHTHEPPLLRTSKVGRMCPPPIGPPKASVVVTEPLLRRPLRGASRTPSQSRLPITDPHANDLYIFCCKEC